MYFRLDYVKGRLRSPLTNYGLLMARPLPFFLDVKLLYEPSCLFVGWFVGSSVGWEVTLPKLLSEHLLITLCLVIGRQIYWQGRAQDFKKGVVVSLPLRNGFTAPLLHQLKRRKFRIPKRHIVHISIIMLKMINIISI